MPAVSTLSQLHPTPRPATMSYPVGDAVVIAVDGALLSGGFPTDDRLALSSGGLTLHGTVRSAVSATPDAGLRS
jgi:hypothetical protein